MRALPTLGLMIILALALGIGLEAPFIAFVVLAVPSILAGAYAGFEAIDRSIIDAARAVGMTQWQTLTKVEVPLGLPLLIGGVRSASLQVISTVTLADYVGAGGLGHFLFLGLKTNDYPQMLAGSIVVIVLALLSEIVFSVLQRVVVPAGVSASSTHIVRSETTPVPLGTRLISTGLIAPKRKGISHVHSRKRPTRRDRRCRGWGRSSPLRVRIE